ncbi:hypothetical protein [Williamsia sp.]|uniref:hypothetical protein n=1 Tax=Williamsia sp. TaxID=1872085 RepID=UPI001A2EA93C|nr:hypothetical protein [Williamsia sp.]MBJ7289175.1 hypothetical protein [Williamsia sp.]
MTFERLVRDQRFASEVATTTVGRLELTRPTSVVTVNANVSSAKTAQLLGAAHARAITENAATLIHAVALPFPGFEGREASEVKPDFAIVAPQTVAGQSWLIMGDAKDYERVRSRVDDARLLKGFLQVALGAEAAASWSKLPADMNVHTHGVLAVPRNAFLQPEALVDALVDHREEVRMRIAERVAEASGTAFKTSTKIDDYVAHLKATFDPASCTTCTLFSFCRNELRTSSDPADLLIELGIAADERPLLAPLLDDPSSETAAPASVHANVRATLTGVAETTGQRRTDPVGLPGNIYVAIAKSDSAALGVHGMSVSRQTARDAAAWSKTVFDDPQSPDTRRRIMRILGGEIERAMAAQEKAKPLAPSPIHIVVPDKPTADILASIADNLAGVELSRLRWARDMEAGREPLTYNGEPAVVPKKLSATERTAVSFLLEEDRARAVILRSPVVDLRSVLASHLVAGGPTVASYRLDYLVEWAETLTKKPADPRKLEDVIESSRSTPGARLTSKQSDDIHTALTGRGRVPGKAGKSSDPNRYKRLVESELEYKQDFFDRAFTVLHSFEDSALLETYRAIEGDAQEVWRRRLNLHASDLVRFGRTYRYWRNNLVPVIESDGTCRTQLLSLSNRQTAHDMAADAGNRFVAFARVISLEPVTLEVRSRRIGEGSRVVLLHNDDAASVEDPSVSVVAQKGSFKFTGLAIGPLSETDIANHYTWTPATQPELVVGDRIVVADFAWYCDLKKNTQLTVARPKADENMAPTPGCTESSYDTAPQAHQWCCKSHEVNEAAWSDQLAKRRARGELNPEAWPPVIDGDAFEVAPKGAPIGNATSEPATTAPDSITIDDLD